MQAVFAAMAVLTFESAALREEASAGTADLVRAFNHHKVHNLSHIRQSRPESGHIRQSRPDYGHIQDSQGQILAI